jgi:hypothetical protein
MTHARSARDEQDRRPTPGWLVITIIAAVIGLGLLFTIVMVEVGFSLSPAGMTGTDLEPAPVEGCEVVHLVQLGDQLDLYPHDRQRLRCYFGRERGQHRQRGPGPGAPPECQWKGIPVMCGPRGLPGDTNVLFHNNGDGTFTDVSEKSGIEPLDIL